MILDSLVKHVRVITGEDSVRINDSVECIPHWTNSDNDLAANFIRDKLESFNLDVYEQPFNEAGGRSTAAIRRLSGLMYLDPGIFPISFN